jgi:hypothetical protein
VGFPALCRWCQRSKKARGAISLGLPLISLFA